VGEGPAEAEDLGSGARGSTAPARLCANCSSRRGKQGEVAMKAEDLARKVRREAVLEPAALGEP
jgi:hypothetical protein